METLSTALTILSAMITPAVLILASGSLSMTTSQRLGRSIDRVRNVSEKLGNQQAGEPTVARQTAETDFLKQELLIAARRCRLMQHAMTSTYFAMTIFVAIIITIGILEVLGLRFAWVLLVMGFAGVSMLFFACFLLILESRLALQSVNKEMDFTLAHYLPDRRTS